MHMGKLFNSKKDILTAICVVAVFLFYIQAQLQFGTTLPSLYLNTPARGVEKSSGEPSSKGVVVVDSLRMDNSTNVCSHYLCIPEVVDPGVAQRVKSIIQIDNNTYGTSLLNDCPVTSQVAILIDNNNKWALQSLDDQGQPKRMGGDEMYVTYTLLTQEQYQQYLNASTDGRHTSPVVEDVITNYTAAAFIHDNQDGTYSLDFSTPPLRPNLPTSISKYAGVLTVHFLYTCGIGGMAPPSKHNWRTGGATHTTHHRLIPVNQPPIREFNPPASLQPNGTVIILENYSLVICLGDSVMQQLIQKDRKWFGPNAYVKGNVGAPLSTATVPHFLSRLKKWHAKEHLNIAKQPNITVALILGSSTWDVIEADPVVLQGELFADHLQACRDLVQSVKQQYPHVDVYWKSPTALHLQRVDNKCFFNFRRADVREECVNRIRYMSNTRAQYLHIIQQQLMMEELHVPYLNVFDAYFLSADSTMDGDGRHYNAYLNAKVLSWYYPNATVRVQE